MKKLPKTAPMKSLKEELKPYVQNARLRNRLASVLINRAVQHYIDNILDQLIIDEELTPFCKMCGAEKYDPKLKCDVPDCIGRKTVYENLEYSEKQIIQKFKEG